jgi:hypothetical protein
MPGRSDAEIRERMNLDPGSKIAKLPRDDRYVLVSVEGI